MNKKLYSLLGNKELRNGLWLYVLQMFNMIVPLLTLPYVTRVLGAACYGLFSISLNWVAYFQVIVEYGFNLSGVRKIAIAKSHEEISSIFCSIVYCKLLLCAVSFIMLLVISVILEVSETQLICMIIMFMMVVGEAIQQKWLFQGLQDMRSITIISVVSRTASVLLIFIFIRYSNQVFLYSAFYAAAYLLIGILSMATAKLQFNIKIVKISFKGLIKELRDGWYLFTSSAMASVFTGIGVTILGFAGNKADVGIYSAILKIPSVMVLMYMPIGQVIYPYISKRYAASLEYGLSALKKPMKYVLIVFAVAAVILALFCKQIIMVLYGEEYTPFAMLMIPLVIWMLFSIVNNLLGIQILVASGHQREYSSAFRVGVLANIILNILLGILWNQFGIASAAMLSEIALTFALLYYVRKSSVLAKFNHN